MSIELVVAKALLGPALGYAGKKAAKWVLGRADENKLLELCSSALGEALDEALEPYSPVQKSEREHLLGLLEVALRNATSSVGGMSTFGLGESQQVVEGSHESQTLDWKTFGLYRDELFHRLDEVGILEEFLSALPSRIRDEARRGDSPLANLAHQLNYGELIRSLDSIRRAVESSAAVGTAQSVADARTRALERQRGVVAARLADDLTRPHYLESGLMHQWLEWSATDNWSADVIEGLLEVVSALNGVADDLARLLEVEAAKTVAHPPTYSSLRLALSRLPLDEASTAISEADTLAGVEKVQRESALRRLRWLNQQVAQPRFHHTFNVAGSLGSGTSRFLTRIAEAVDGSNDQVLFVSTGPGESFTNAILRQLSESFGLDFRDIRDTHVLLSDANGDSRRLDFLVEDVDQQVGDETGLNDLLDLIEASTAVPGIRWCLGANLDDLNAVLPSSRPYVWATYGFAPKEEADAGAGAIGGWFNLDTLNASRGLGLRLLQQLVAEERPDLRTMLEHRQEFGSEAAAYANPLPAWMRYEAMALGLNSRPVSDPQDPDFIRQYWTFLKQRHLRPNPRSRAEAEQAEVELTVTTLARRLHTSGQPSVPLYTAGDANAPWTTLEPGPSAALRRMGLLRLSYQGDPEVEALVLAAVPVFAPFWGYRIGRLIVTGKSTGGDAPASLDHDLRSWYQRANHGEALAEAVCQFTLGALAEEGEDQRGQAIWQEWKADIYSPRVPFLMAGAAAPDQFSQFAVQLVTKPRYKPLTKRETFVMMRLVAKASSPDWKADQRLKVLSTQREAVMDHGLHTYASHATQAVLLVPELVERANFVNTCDALMGCERTGTAQIAAKLVADHGIRLFDSREELVRYAIKFLQRVSKPPADGAQTRKPKSKKKGGGPTKSANPLTLTSPDGNTFPQRFIDSLLDRLVNRWDAAETVRMLARFGWWTARRQQIDGHIAFHMSQQLNLAFGRTVHRTGPDEAYVGVVEDLLKGTLLAHAHYQERFLIVMYLVKHSVPTYGRWYLEVDRSLHPALLTLWNDGDFRNRQRDKLEALCNANELPVD